MNDMLNSAQHRSVAIALRTFEFNLRQIIAWLDGLYFEGILCHSRLYLNPTKQMEARNQIAIALEHIAVMAQVMDLDQEITDPGGLIRGQLSISWANLIDIQSGKLKRYGDVNPDLQHVIDPTIQLLAKTALALTQIFEENELGGD